MDVNEFVKTIVMSSDEINAISEEDARGRDQAKSMQKLFAAVVLTALDDAIGTAREPGGGVNEIRSWSRSRDGREVLTLAGIEPTEQVTEALAAFVRNGVRTSRALTRIASEMADAESDAVAVAA